MRYTANFQTARGPQLMSTMAKHFGHKIPVEQDDRRASMTFEWGDAEIAVVEDGLSLNVEGESTEGAARLKQVIESHLLRFAFREDPQAIQWSEDAASDR